MKHDYSLTALNVARLNEVNKELFVALDDLLRADELPPSDMSSQIAINAMAHARDVLEKSRSES